MTVTHITAAIVPSGADLGQLRKVRLGPAEVIPMAPSAIAEVKETHPPVTGPTLRSTPRPPSSGVEGGPALARALFNDALIENHREVVADYISRYASGLPPIAVRETSTKLRTGTKSGRSKRA